MSFITRIDIRLFRNTCNFKLKVFYKYTVLYKKKKSKKEVGNLYFS